MFPQSTQKLFSSLNQALNEIERTIVDPLEEKAKHITRTGSRLPDFPLVKIFVLLLALILFLKLFKLR
jgi:hypothetical protein